MLLFLLVVTGLVVVEGERGAKGVMRGELVSGDWDFLSGTPVGARDNLSLSPHQKSVKI